MSWQDIRPITLGIIRRDDEMLLQEIEDPESGELMYRPLGGGIEFGETTSEALRREFQEELDAQLVNLSLLGMVENIFTFSGQENHQVEFIFGAEFADDQLYDVELLEFEEDTGRSFEARWFTKDDIEELTPRLVPDGLKGLLTNSTEDADDLHLVDGPVLR